MFTWILLLGVLFLVQGAGFVTDLLASFGLDLSGLLG